MKISQSLVSTGVICIGFSLGLLACGSSNSTSSPGVAGVGGGSADIPASCPNIALEGTGNNAVTDQKSIPDSDFSLSHLTVYVYDPGTGDSFSASADARNGFNATSGCNQTSEAGRHSETASAPESLDSSRKIGPQDQDRVITADFENTKMTLSSSLVPDRSGSFVLDNMGQGRELAGSDKFVTYQFFLTQNGGLKILSTTEMPVDPTTGKRKLLFVAADYQPQGQIQPAPQPGRPGPAPQPGGPHH
jgi:hypothetical protein